MHGVLYWGGDRGLVGWYSDQEAQINYRLW